MNKVVIVFFLVVGFVTGYYGDDLWDRAKHEGFKIRLSANASAGQMLR